MFFTALTLDGLSLVFALSGLCVFVIPNLLINLGGVFLGFLMYIQTGSSMKKPGKRIMKKIGISALIEFIPVLAGFVPIWTLTVYSHLKKTS